MIDPLFWLGLSLLLVAISLTAVLVAALPALRDLSRAARSAEKLFDTLSRDLPPTLEAIRLTGLELTDLSDDVSEGVQEAGRVVKQVDQSLGTVRQQAKKAQKVTRSVVVGVRAAWHNLMQPPPSKSARASRLPQASRPSYNPTRPSNPIEEQRFAAYRDRPDLLPDSFEFDPDAADDLDGLMSEENWIAAEDDDLGIYDVDDEPNQAVGVQPESPDLNPETAAEPGGDRSRIGLPHPDSRLQPDRQNQSG